MYRAGPNTHHEIKVAIVEDDDFTRQRISSILQLRVPQSNIVEFQDLKTALKFAATNAQDFWLIDLGLPDGSGIELIRAVKKIHQHANVLVLSVFGDVENIVNSIEAGANGYLLKDAVERDLIHALDAIDSGGTPLSPMIASRLLERMLPTKTSDSVAAKDDLLTTREAELLNFVAWLHRNGSR